MEDQNKNSDPNPFPHMDILPGIGFVKRLGGVMIRFIYFFPSEAPDCMSDHNSGAAPLLDEHLQASQWTDEKK